MPQEVKLCSPDYKDAEVDTAVADFQKRIKNYELAYKPLDTKTDKYVRSPLALLLKCSPPFFMCVPLNITHTREMVLRPDSLHVVYMLGTN